MGLDRDYQAMPEECTLLERSRHDLEFGCHLEFFKSFAFISDQQLAHRNEDKVFVEFVAEAKQVVKNHIDIEKRTLSLGRHWDMLHYLLSEDRRNSQKEDGSQCIEKAILGGEVLNERTQTTIGSPIRYLSPIEVLYITENLEAATLESLGVHWNPRAMSQASVYKIHINAGDDTLSFLKKEFENLQLFTLKRQNTAKAFYHLWGRALGVRKLGTLKSLKRVRGKKSDCAISVLQWLHFLWNWLRFHKK